MLRQTLPGSIRSVGPREFKFTLCTAQLARDGHVLLPAGMDLRDYKKNPVVLFFHQPEKPVARCTQIGLIDGEIRGTAEFPPEGASPTAALSVGRMALFTFSVMHFTLTRTIVNDYKGCNCRISG
ncbi:MAG TPA: hypothetical protein VJX94_31875 [Stellaceae bacterium]|nr:hypothetical protein [Stellaceae bacterium]